VQILGCKDLYAAVQLQDLALVIVLTSGNDYTPRSLHCSMSRGIWTYFMVRSLPYWQERSLLMQSTDGQTLAFDAEFCLHYLLQASQELARTMWPFTAGFNDGSHKETSHLWNSTGGTPLSAPQASSVSIGNRQSDLQQASKLEGVSESHTGESDTDAASGELVEASEKFGYCRRERDGRSFLQLPRQHRSLLEDVEMDLLPECVSLEELAKTMTDPRLLALLDWADGHQLPSSTRVAVLAAALSRHQV
jgi:hypothetical protein